MEHSSFSTPIIFVRRGNIVTMTETNNIKSLVSSQYIDIGTLPSNFWPRAYVYCFGGPAALTGMNIQIEITNTGIVRIYNYGNDISSTGIPCRFSLTYLTA